MIGIGDNPPSVGVNVVASRAILLLGNERLSCKEPVSGEVESGSSGRVEWENVSFDDGVLEAVNHGVKAE